MVDKATIATVGVIKPVNESVSHPQLESIMPDGVAFKSVHLGVQYRSVAEFREVMALYEERVLEMAARGVDLLHPEGAPPFMLEGLAGERDRIKAWEDRFQIPVFTTGMTQLAAMEALGIRKFVGVTPFSGELADGASLNWCTPEQIAWSRERMDEGATKAGRNPSDVKMAEYIRICIDDDEDVARVALAKATMGYALGPRVPTERESQLGYRGHFARMGFEKELADLNQMRADGATKDEVAEAFPAHVLSAVAYFGKADGAAAAFKRLSEGLDTTIVRVVAARPNLDSVRAVMEACAPAKIEAA